MENKTNCCEPTSISDDCCSTTITQPKKSSSKIREYPPAIVSFLMLIIGIFLDYIGLAFFTGAARIIWYSIAYLPVGWPVLKQAWERIIKGDFFTEFFLMGIATIGAFALGHYHEGVAVMLFYTLGELFQHAAVHKSKQNIQALLDIRPNNAKVFRNGNYIDVHPQEVEIGEKIQVRTGEKIPLDGQLLSTSATVDTAAITGESKPEVIRRDETLFAGSINMDGVIEVKTSKGFEDSSIAKILHLVQEASSRKAKTELFIRKFARVYTPIVFFSAIALTLVPYFFVESYIFQDWLYRALVFLVVSCPCALVISIPLGYFGGLGAASKNGILFKGASFLEALTKVNTIVVDKTGTLTKGVFEIKAIKAFGIDKEEMMRYLIALERQSTHPIATAILKYPSTSGFTATGVKEVGGKGLQGIVNDQEVLVGNSSLMTDNGISLPSEIDTIAETIVIVALDGKLVGYVTVADQLKDDAKDAIGQIKKLGIHNILMLSGDKVVLTEKIGQELGLNSAKGGLLPEDKLAEIVSLQKNPRTKIAFVGDGINDAPVIAASNVGIAMGALGSDVAIETADVVIQTDHPSKIALAIKIARSTKNIVWQNIALAFGVKLIVLLLGAGGIATMWEAVFADVGVAFLAILNAIRLQRMHWS